jgi:hypothetical protein
METYIVRVYLREEGASERIAGTVELVERRQQCSFSDLQSLVDILSARQRDANRPDPTPK